MDLVYSPQTTGSLWPETSCTVINSMTAMMVLAAVEVRTGQQMLDWSSEVTNGQVKLQFVFVMLIYSFFFLLSCMFCCPLSSRQQDHYFQEKSSLFQLTSLTQIGQLFSSLDLPNVPSNCFSLCNLSEVVRGKKAKDIVKIKSWLLCISSFNCFSHLCSTSNKNQSSWDLYSKPWILLKSSVLCNDKAISEFLCDALGPTIPSKPGPFLTLLSSGQVSSLHCQETNV